MYINHRSVMEKKNANKIFYIYKLKM